MIDIDLCYTPAAELARRIREGKLSPVRLIENTLERIAAVNLKLNCFCFVYPEESLEIARECEAEAKAGNFRGPLHGVPFAIKDLTPTNGKRTTLGSYTHENWVPDYDAPIVEALKNAGGIMVGKTTTPEFAYSSFTESPLWGITRNPWNPGRCAGGSSGGSGAAVASGCVPIAEGSDMGGSVRIPASFCGTLGLKPSFGRIPFTILPSQFDQISHFGPLARSVEDICLFMQVTQGPDERDIQSLKPALDFTQPLPNDLRGKRLALCLDFGNRLWHPDVEAAIRRSAATLREAGAEIEEVSLSWSLDEDELWSKHWAVYLAAFFGHVLPEFRSKMDPLVVRLIERGLAMSAVEFKQLEFGRTEMWRELSPILERCDALLCPTMAQPAPTHGRSDQDFWRLDAQGRYLALDVTSVWNFVSQCPAISIPAGFSNDGLPIGLQVVGRRFDDLTPIGIAAIMEKRQPWGGKRPPV
ncbi:MAG TPA: amidase [Dongiaceae bacterium]|jgi:Asp-tRNA(Asn)/Glu-tRNA(Gln) amidotransferase A subunit family amidase